MIRSIEIRVDYANWFPVNIPLQIFILRGTWQANVLVSLIYTALWTRPPVTYGFHLSDCWAWFRYYIAISNVPALKLRGEWETIDPHQKTILSDELSIGFTTHLLIEKLECLWFVDTLHLVKLFPKYFNLGKSTKTGPRKSPDYIGFDTNLDYYVLECKGTQTSYKALQKAVTGGKIQKHNLSVNPTKLKYSLVAGLFIAQWSSNESSCISIGDPTWEELEEFLNEYSEDDINTAILQLALAKHLSLIGLTGLAQVLAETPTDDIELSEAARSEIDRWLETSSEEEFRVLFDTRAVFFRFSSIETRFPEGRFLVSSPDYLLVELRDSQAVGGLLRELYRTLFNSQESLLWSSFSDEVSAVVTSPLGFKFRLEFF
ncbi:hypothetical protein IQ268_26030 [Oculatella sp. LEGE 06141]|uniref:hypothetical protein n=1 Tax=Oculatella sp. LEGE 06141 TaxID=1828648 RepID=UPI0018820EB9|nr:hypothetical protein [Oculatella sp. LEGE 06141]MBE9182031.1 hypothetical protein [Oculatella sp. LEGE 06141]